MLETIKVTILARARRADFWIWCLAFPVILATLFIFMFGSLKNTERVEAVPVAVVEDEAWDGSAFAQVVDGLAKGDGRLLACRRVDSAEAGEKLLDEGEVAGVYAVDSAGAPQVVLGPGADASDGTSAKSINRTILETVASSYTQSAELIARIASEDPRALADGAAVSRALGIEGDVKRISLTRSTPDDTVRFYYALLGMAALYASTAAASALLDAAGDLSPLGARRCVGGQSRLTMLAGTLVGCWAIAYACLVLVFLYVRFAAGVDFAGREGMALLGLAAASLLAVAFGMLVAAVPLGGGKQSRTGLITAVNCVGSLFAGLYGMPSMALADSVARACPAEAWLNPPKLICDTFTDLYYYESLIPYFTHVLVCAALAAACLAVTTAVFRRQRYEHL